VTIRASTGDDVVTADGGRIEVYGGPGRDRIRTGSFGDRVIGGRGADSIDTGAGNDEVHARDGTRDRVRCGAGQDAVEADEIDLLSGCEEITSGGPLPRRPAARARIG
jgi:Ca2+-binding RTX toxin-like protein